MAGFNAQHNITRRGFLTAAAASGLLLARARTAAADVMPFPLHYSLASCMYGTLPLAEILPEVRKTGADNIDLWPANHGNQREQLDEMGVEAYRTLCRQHGVYTAILTRYDLGPFNLHDEMKMAAALGAGIIVTGSRKPVHDEKAGARAFAEDLKPHLDVAAEHGVRIAIENHANALVHSPDSIRYLADELDTPHAGIALAPYHLPQNPLLIANIIRDLGPRLADRKSVV